MLAVLHRSSEGLTKAACAQGYVLCILLRAPKPPSVKHGGDSSGCYPRERIENETIFGRKRKDESLDETNGELARMCRLFDMIAFDVWNLPNVLWILSLRVPRELACTGALVVALARIFC